MADLVSEKLQVIYKDETELVNSILPRKYTLTHSDSTGDLFLTIGVEYDYQQISGLYTRFMRDEVLAEWKKVEDNYELHLYLHVSGGFLFGWAGMRDRIFRHHLPLVFQTIKQGDKSLYKAFPFLSESQVFVHFNSKNKKYDKVENFGKIKDI
ncbi:MAG: staygreen family protein [Candidatus Hermodarchaeota archaeon]